METSVQTLEKKIQQFNELLQYITQYVTIFVSDYFKIEERGKD